jgi:single-stranded-DNA-specific exonuclease
VRWNLRPSDPLQIESLAIALRQSSALRLEDSRTAFTLARLLTARGVAEVGAAEQFLFPSLAHLHSPSLMTGMKAAVDRLDSAIENKERILIYGDYDVDGTTAIVILKTAIELCGGTADFHVPHRIRDGYDMRDDVIERAAAAGIHLIISVDMGIRAFGPAGTARRLGVDLIVTDHHLPGPDGVPDALAVINPNQPVCDYPCKMLCGAGVAFKLAQALIERRRSGDQSHLLASFMKVVAIATIADSVPLTGENRVFAKLGLEGLRTAVNPGLKALLETAQLGGKPLTSGEVAFRIAPRINAAGRMDVARDVIDLFSVKDPARARGIAERLDQLNAERQEEERRIVAAIEARCEEDALLRDAFCMVIDGEGWHRGVIGITATRVVERYHRPALVISRDGDEAHGSGRSIRPFHLLNALESCAHLFTRYGGHSHAVGFSLPSSRVPDLRAHLDAYARTHLTLADLEPTLELEGELSLEELAPQFFQVLQRLEPFGVGNREPIFSARVRLLEPARVMKEKHVKLRVSAAPPDISTDPDAPNELAIAVTPRCHPDAASFPRRTQSWRSSVSYNAMGWRMAERWQQEQLLPGDVFDIAFSLGYNDHPEFGGMELTLRDFRGRTNATPVAGSSEAAEQPVKRNVILSGA